MAALPDEVGEVSFADSLRPKSREELHAMLPSSTKRPPSQVTNKLANFCAARAECEARCHRRLKERAVFEASLLGGSPKEAEDHLLQAQQRFQALEGHCSVICGRRLLPLLQSGGSAFPST
eukprot:gnl/MRDRNA2_/MRDRNA2_138458_c0_seq1.p1 gnl/MRDRNA2_/MRDRNA2_138458_c0~~gnl/MRDRNA2_/MRDRNA2_138458_c0_seq1.p1  ORF type:complete len:121 (+),score=23.01 gnl/MRDRNA2_/MRDRNA2_138458_c0_seq1:92-454(+)